MLLVSIRIYNRNRKITFKLQYGSRAVAFLDLQETLFNILWENDN